MGEGGKYVLQEAPAPHPALSLRRLPVGGKSGHGGSQSAAAPLGKDSRQPLAQAAPAAGLPTPGLERRCIPLQACTRESQGLSRTWGHSSA